MFELYKDESLRFILLMNTDYNPMYRIERDLGVHRLFCAGTRFRTVLGVISNSLGMQLE